MFADYSKIPLELVESFHSELMIKEIPLGNDTLPKLVFKIRLVADHPVFGKFGFVDAQTGKVLFTEPAIINVSATGTFNTTRYSGLQQAQTDRVGTNSYVLYNNTRGAIIYTRNLNNSSNIANRVELQDNDNNWTTAEHGPSNNDMSLDIHWGLQRIYDHLWNTHSRNSFDDNGAQIDAYIKWLDLFGSKDNAGWDLTNHYLSFGEGNTTFKPVASVDVVAHEFGHGITQFQIGWLYNSTTSMFHEGMSDIWGAIMKYRITPTQSTWLIGSQIMKSSSYSCLRNIQNTNDLNALTQIANTYNTSQYNQGDQYVQGGVFSHWFYLLVNGGNGINGVGNSYKVYGLGMDIAENLIVEAVFTGNLRNTTSYAQLRTAFVQAANVLDGGQNGFITQQVENAWWAVNVGIQPPQISISGPSVICTGRSYTFSVVNAPAGFTWDKSSNFTLSGSGNSVTVSATNSTSGWVAIKSGSTELVRYGVSVCSSAPVFDYIEGPDEVTPGSETYYYQAHFNNATPTDYEWSVYGAPSSWYVLTSNGYSSTGVCFIGEATYAVYVHGSNACGGSGGQILVAAYSRGGQAYTVYPNPVDDILTISAAQQAGSGAKTVQLLDIRLYDLQGNLALRKTANNSADIQLNVSGLRDGNYFLHIYEGLNAMPYMKQIVVRH